MKRKIISINEEICNGCGVCVEGCHEGALQMIDNKARIVSELYCDGLGACIGDCPVQAITIEEREADPYNEVAVMARIASKGEKTVLAHLKHLKEHNETTYLSQAIEYIKQHNLPINLNALETDNKKMACGCPGSMNRAFAAPIPLQAQKSVPSQLTHWPVQLHLLNPEAGYFAGADVVVAADCAAYAYGNFHTQFLKERKLAIGCPKLDSGTEQYIEKISTLIDDSKINTLHVVIMEVPCCKGLVQMVKTAAERAQRKVPIKQTIIGVQGDIIREEWI